MRIVLFTQRVEVVESYGERRDCADQQIAAFVRACGYLPVAVPNDADTAEELFHAMKQAGLAGILLTGGNSLVPYGGNAPERDEAEERLISLAVENRTPVYGFCRGMQMILHHFGNMLVQVTGHVAVRHAVSGDEEPWEVNSYHNQACVELTSPELTAVMRTADGVIEKIRHKELPIVATMWHPESEKPFTERDINAVRSLFGNG